jgi:hypothetical protein
MGEQTHEEQSSGAAARGSVSSTAMLQRLIFGVLLCAALPASAASVKSTWLGGIGTWTDAHWSIGVPQNTSTDSFDAVIDGGNPVSSQVTLDSAATVGSLQVDAGDALVLTPIGGLNLEGSQIANAGEITLQGPASLMFETPGSVLSGGGSIRLDGGDIEGGDGLVNMDNRIAGSGSISGSGFVNYGVIEADVPGKGLGISANGENYGTMRATGGGALGFGLNPSFINRGTVEALDGSSVGSADTFGSAGGTFTALRHSTMSLAGNYNGTLFVTDADSQITFDGCCDHGVLSDVTFDGQILLGNTPLSGTITNRASIRGALTAYAPTTVVNQGQILFQYEQTPFSAALTFSGGGAVTIDPTNGAGGGPLGGPPFSPIRNLDNEMRGTGRLWQLLQNGGLIEASGGTLEIGGSVEHTGVFAAAPGSTLEIGAPDLAATVTGSGSWRADGGRIHVTGDVGTTGDIEVLHGGALAVDTTMSGGNLVVDDTGALDVQGALRIAGNVDFDGVNAARWSFAPGASLHAARGGGAAVGDWAGWQRLEVAGRDLGADPSGFTADNFYLPELVVDADGRLALRDRFDNGNRSGDAHEALYVDTLVFSDSLGLLDVNGINLYFNHLVGSLDQIIDVAVPEPGLEWLVACALVGLVVSRRTVRV